jgi:TIR domain
MTYRHASFISWAHAKEDLGRTFIENLHGALSGSLELHVKQGVYLDKQRLRPAYDFNAALAEAMCESACWVLVFSPRYLLQDYCRREYAAMQALEQARRNELGGKLPRTHRMIIPVLLRGDDSKIPVEIKSSRQMLDFRSFSLADPDMARNAAYAEKIEETAEYIAELCELGRPGAPDCATFELPALPPGGGPDNDILEFPGRPESN